MNSDLADKCKFSLTRLEIETAGRMRTPTVPLHGRKSRICLIAIENEFHLVLKCPLHGEFRKKGHSKSIF